MIIYPKINFTVHNIVLFIVLTLPGLYMAACFAILASLVITSKRSPSFENLKFICFSITNSSWTIWEADRSKQAKHQFCTNHKAFLIFTSASAHSFITGYTGIVSFSSSSPIVCQ